MYKMDFWKSCWKKMCNKQRFAYFSYEIHFSRFPFIKENNNSVQIDFLPNYIRKYNR